MTDRATAGRILRLLMKTPVGERAVLVGSSSLLGFDTKVPALTEDIDLCVPSELVEREGNAIVEVLQSEGWTHEDGTATFVSADGVTFDLLGYDDPIVIAEHRTLPTGEQAITDARLQAELIGAVGLRPDLFALVE